MQYRRVKTYKQRDNYFDLLEYGVSTTTPSITEMYVTYGVTNYSNTAVTYDSSTYQTYVIQTDAGTETSLPIWDLYVWNTNAATTNFVATPAREMHGPPLPRSMDPERKARKLFIRLFGRVAYKQYKKLGYHEVIGASGESYRVYPSKVFKAEDKEHWYCLVLAEALCVTDVVIAKALLLTAQKDGEDAFLSKAIKHKIAA